MNSSNKSSKTSSIPVSTIQKGRVSLSMLKGRPGSVSVPSFSFRFNPTDDNTLEELGELGECATEARENGEESAIATTTPPPLSSTTATSTLSSTVTTTTTTASTLDRRATPTPPPSPPENGSSGSMKGKRALSFDGTCVDPSPQESWSLLNKIKGGLARKVEEAKKYRLEFQPGNLLKKDPVIKSLERGSSTESAVEDAVPELFPEVQHTVDTSGHHDTSTSQQQQQQPAVTVEPEIPEAVELRLRKTITGSEEPLVTFSRSSKHETADDNVNRVETKTSSVAIPSSPTPVSSSSSSQPPLQRSIRRQFSILVKTKYACYSALILMLVVVPLSDFTHGLLTGILLTLGTIYLWMKVFWPSEVTLKEPSHQNEIVEMTMPNGKSEKPASKKVRFNHIHVVGEKRGH